MIISKKMEEPVEGQQKKLPFKGVSELSGLFSCSVYGNEYIPKYVARVLRVWPLPHGKSEYVCCAFSFRVFVVQLGHGRIINKDNSQLTIYFLFCQNEPNYLLYVPRFRLALFRKTLYVDFHFCPAQRRGIQFSDGTCL